MQPHSKLFSQFAVLSVLVLVLTTSILQYDRLTAYVHEAFKKGDVSTGAGDNVRAGTPLTSAMWNKIINTLADLTGEIMIDQNNHKVGIGTTNIDPASKLHVEGGLFVKTKTDTGELQAGRVKITLGAGAGKVLTSDTNGAATWETPASSPWTEGTGNVSYVGGNVGIGTVSPTTKLEVAGDIKATTSAGGVFATNISNRDFDFRGNTATNRVLTVHPGINAGIDFGNIVVDFYGNDGTTYIPGFTMRRNGNVGIGTTNPSAKLDVLDTDPISSWVLGRFIGNSPTANHFIVQSNTDTGYATMQVRSKESLEKFSELYISGDGGRSGIVGNTDQFILNSGKVAIGNIVPAHKLDVAGYAGFGPRIYPGLNGTENGSALVHFKNISGAAYIRSSKNYDDDGNAPIRFEGSSFGFEGNSPSLPHLIDAYNPYGAALIKLGGPGDDYDYGGISMWDTAHNKAWQISHRKNEANKLQWHYYNGTNWIAPITFDTLGNVGIGTATPTEKLEVAGNIKMSGTGNGIMFPDGTTQTTATNGAVLPTGAIMPFYLSTCPSGWVVADGTNGTPDLRGEFIRGLDVGRGVDSGRMLGSTQSDAFKSHVHSMSTLDLGANPYSGGGTKGPYNRSWGPGETAPDTVATGGTETRPRNIALLYCMKF